MTQERISIRVPLAPSQPKPAEEEARTRIQEGGERPAASPPPPPASPPGPDATALARELIELLGEAPLAALAANPHLRLPNDLSDGAPTTERWAEGVLKSFVSLDGIQRMREGVRAGVAEPRRLLAEATEALAESERRVAERDGRILTLERKIADLDVTIHKAREAVSRTVPLALLLDRMREIDPQIAGVVEVLREATREPSPDIGAFTVALWAAWPSVMAATGAEAPEERRMEKVGEALRHLLGSARGLYFPERRDALSKVGEVVSQGFRDFVFVSPEDRRHIDPTIHNAVGVRGTTVKEGLSFAVVRRSSGQPVIYADIIAE